MDNFIALAKPDILREIKRLILEKCPNTHTFESHKIKKVFFSRHDDAGDYTTQCLEQPIAVLGVQGNKIITLGKKEFRLSPGKVLVNCLEIPSSFILTDISPEKPFLSLWFMLDKKILAELSADLPPDKSVPRNPFTYGVIDAHFDILDAFLRMARVVDKPNDAAVLGALIMRELHYFLLASSLGPLLRGVLLGAQRDNRVLDAIAWLKKNLDKAIPVEALARYVNMSVSSLHRHFKELTGFSPLQYHKRLRLFEAQRLMLAENERADAASQAVGYESVTQFNREYKRMFGEPPRRDVARRRKHIP